MSNTGNDSGDGTDFRNHTSAGSTQKYSNIPHRRGGADRIRPNFGATRRQGEIYAAMGVETSIVEIKTSLVSFSQAISDLNQSLNSSQELVRTSIKDLGDKVDNRFSKFDDRLVAVNDKMGDPDSGFGALKSKIEEKPGKPFVFVVAIGIVGAISGLIAYADSIRALLKAG